MGADIFSIFGIRNIAEWLKDWIQSYKVGLELCDRSKFPGKLETFGIDAMNLRQPGFIGYTVQQYITKSTKGERRPTQAFERILQQIPDQIDTSLGSYLAPHLKANAAKLGDVPNMFSLIPLAQSVNSPISGLQAADGLAGGQYQQQTNYVETIKKVTSALSINLESARGDLK